MFEKFGLDDSIEVRNGWKYEDVDLVKVWKLRLDNCFKILDLSKFLLDTCIKRLGVD